MSKECIVEESTGLSAEAAGGMMFLFILSLSVGASIAPGDVSAVWARKKRSLLVGFASQYGMMPLLAFGFAKLFDVSDLRAVGILLVGISPSGSTSNLFTVWMKGNAALSAVMSAASSLIAFVSIPVLFQIYVRGALGISSDELKVPYVNLIVSLLSLLCAVFIGAELRRANTILKIYNKYVWEWLQIVGAVVGALFLLSVLVKGMVEHPELVKAADYPDEWTSGAVYLPLGCLFGYLSARLIMGLQYKDAIAVGLESGIQNYPITVVIVDLMFSGCANDEVGAFAKIASFWYVIDMGLIVVLFRIVYFLRPGAFNEEGSDSQVCDTKTKVSRIKPVQSGSSIGSISSLGGLGGQEGGHRTAPTPAADASAWAAPPPPREQEA